MNDENENVFHAPCLSNAFAAALDDKAERDGKWLFSILGITLSAFQIAGSLVLLLVALDKLRARHLRVRQTPAETNAGAEKEGIASRR
jgi:hypothetical protein